MNWRITLIYLNLIPCVLFLALIGCEGKKGDTALYTGPTETPSSTALKVPFKDPIEPVLYELTTGSLATWRDYIRYKPTLLLFSTHPLLDPLPEGRRTLITELLRNGSSDEVVRRACALTSDPAILPPEAVSAAVDNGIFSELVIILPNLKKPEEVNLDELRSRATRAGFISEEEAMGLSLTDGIVTGTVRGLPLRFVHPDRLPQIPGPVILHIDLGYFKDMYINEIKTPAYEMLYQFATNVKDADLKTLATTMSFSNLEVGFSLESRFLIRDLAAILRKPKLLDGGTSPSWTLRSQALYARSMFSESRARELTAKAAQSNPEDAAAHYALSLDLLKQNHEYEAFAALDKSVAIDRGYGLEYLELAARGKEIGRTEKSIELLQKAANTFPDNPFIRRELAHQLIQIGRVKEARPLIDELLQLTWSEAFYPDIPPLLEQMEEAASVEVVLPKSPPAQSSVGQPDRPSGGLPSFNHMGMGIPKH